MVKEAQVFAGFVDSWDGRTIGGWAVDRSRPGEPCDVDVYVDGRFAVRSQAGLQRPDLGEVSPADQRKGFRVDLPSNGVPTARIEVCFGGTKARIPTIQGLDARVWRPRIDLLQPLNGVASRWVPTPPGALITHISGEAGDEAMLSAQYRRIGFTVAADIYNTALDLGLDPHRADFSIVDLGCGCGRIASYLSQWLEQSQFLGVDIWNAGIDWATANITAEYGAYKFHCAVAQKKGYESGEHHRVPVGDGGVDYVISTSLFTHLDVGACDGYLREISRILKPGGLAYLTFFFLEERSKPAAERMARDLNLSLKKQPDAWFYGRGGYIDIFHHQDRVLSVATDAGLRPVLHREGSWRGPASSTVNPMAFQDLLVFRKD